MSINEVQMQCSLDNSIRPSFNYVMKQEDII